MCDELGQCPSQVAFPQGNHAIEALMLDQSSAQSDPRRHWRELSIVPQASGEAETFRVTHPFHPLCGRTFQLVDCRQTSGEDRVYFYDDSGHLARFPLQWTDVVPDDPTVVVGAGRAHFRYDDLCRLADLLTGLDAALPGARADREC
jgi:hypothetical protein